MNCFEYFYCLIPNMAGIYIHIPFCKQACHYCDFHFSTSLRYKDQLINALIDEIALKHEILASQTIHTIYFGGGTPSLLSGPELKRIIDSIAKYTNLSALEECTLEANPDDLNISYLKSLKEAGVTRLSIGIQSFHDSDLQWMNRAHNAKEAHKAIHEAAKLGFNNLSIDLIFGSPTTTHKMWAENLNILESLPIQHLSTYALTVEAKTPLAKMISNGSASPKDGMMAQQFEMLMDHLDSKGWEQYEISNSCKNGMYAQHNSSYWLGNPYIGIGPSAHSFINGNRSWNISNNNQYIAQIETGIVPETLETLSAQEKYNEFLMTRLRTIWGVPLSALQNQFPDQFEYFNSEITHWIDQEYAMNKSGVITLTRKGKLIADRIASELFIVD